MCLCVFVVLDKKWITHRITYCYGEDVVTRQRERRRRRCRQRLRLCGQSEEQRHGQYRRRITILNSKTHIDTRHKLYTPSTRAATCFWCSISEYQHTYIVGICPYCLRAASVSKLLNVKFVSHQLHHHRKRVDRLLRQNFHQRCADNETERIQSLFERVPYFGGVLPRGARSGATHYILMP